MPSSPTELNWHEALVAALDELASAEAAFQNADDDFLDYHIYRLQAAEAKVSLILKKAREVWGISSSRHKLLASGFNVTIPNPTDTLV